MKGATMAVMKGAKHESRKAANVPGQGREPRQGRTVRGGRPLNSPAEEKLALLADLVPKLARAIGPMCEVVLHENTSTPPTIRAIGNGHVTGRQVGDLMTQIMIDNHDVGDRRTPLFNYVSQTPAGRKIRVSLLPVLHDDKVIGYVAVNFSIQDLDAARQTLALLAAEEPHKEAIKETFLSTHDIIERTANEYVRQRGKPIALFDKADRVEFVRILKERGAFGMREAVGKVASALGVSRTAIYNYLNDTGSW